MNDARRRRIAGAVAATVVLAALLLAAANAPDTNGEPAGERPPAPAVPDGPLDPAAAEGLDRIIGRFATTIVDVADVEAVGAAGDPRALWEFSDLLRLLAGRPDGDAVVAVASELAGTDVVAAGSGSDWVDLTNLLIAWDLPAAPGYVERKAAVLTQVDQRWAPFFADADATVDWRFVGWGGVRMDDRPLGDAGPCAAGCIPALDDPGVTDAAGGDWYPDDATVFGVVIDGDARAYPKNVMEIHEMVNDTLGGRRLGIPYCTLCGSAQAYLTDEVDPSLLRDRSGEGVQPDDEVVLRTSGLLARSNKMMFDLTTGSLIDTFTGRATSGPLLDARVVLPQATVVTTSWGAWKQSHPATTIVAEDGGIGRSYPADPLGGRDDDGPIFPIGDVDPRLAAQARVLGVALPDGGHLAVDAVAARAALLAGDEVEVDGVTITLDGSGLRARQGDRDLAVHEAFWFAWSQFHPATALWPAP